MTDVRDALKHTLIRTVEATCEILTFMFPMPPPEDDTAGERSEEIARVRVHFDGPFAGSLLLGMPRSMLPALAANMLGVDAETTTPEQREDAASELCNVVCGNLLPAVAGARPVFTVGAPKLCERAPSAAPEARVSGRAWFDEGWVEAEFVVDEGLVALSSSFDPRDASARSEPGA